MEQGRISGPKVQERESGMMPLAKIGVSGLVAVLCAPLLLGQVVGNAQAALEYTEKKEHALDLYRQNKMADAASALEQLAAVNDKDTVVFSALGFTLFAMISTAADQDREQLAMRARKALEHAKALGDKSELTDMALSRLQQGTPGPSKFSTNPEADLAMQRAEVDFVQGRLDQAIELYQRALSVDPKLYDAALFIGDSYYKSPGGMNQAPQWFAKAIAIDPNRETAYRYWADVLMKQGDGVGARDKYVEAYICEPHNRLAVSGFTTWSKNQHVTLAHPAIVIPTNFERHPDGNTSITLDPDTLNKKDNGGAAWLMYGMTRALWSNGEFLKKHPDENKYRHSLEEEAEALRAVLHTLDAKARRAHDLDASLAILLKLDQQGELEAYILLARSDEGIAKDYLPYLRDHRDQLRAYVVDWVLKGGHAQ
jgi:tetratricopeptide (TPR) repeat protein